MKLQREAVSLFHITLLSKAKPNGTSPHFGCSGLSTSDSMEELHLVSKLIRTLACFTSYCVRAHTHMQIVQCNCGCSNKLCSE